MTIHKLNPIWDVYAVLVVMGGLFLVTLALGFVTGVLR